MYEQRRKHALARKSARERYALPHMRGCGTRRGADRASPDDVRGRVERAHEWSAASGEDRQCARETRGVEAREHAAYDWRGEQQRMPAFAPALAPQQQHRRNAGCCEQTQPVPAGGAQEFAAGDQRTRKPRQRLPALLIDGNDLRHDVEHQRRDDTERDHRHESWVDQRHGEFLSQRLSRFEVIRQLRQDAAQLTAFGTHGNQAAIELGESPGKPRQRAGERFARRDLLAHRTQHAHRGGVIRLLGDCTQCLVERHPRCDQRRELTRRQREYRRREPRGIGPACE